MPAGISSAALTIASGLSSGQAPAAAADAASAAAGEHLGSRPAHAVFVFFSAAFAHAAPAIARAVRRRLRCECVIGVSAGGVIGGSVEMEDAAGVSVLALSARGATFDPFPIAALLESASARDPGAAAHAARIGPDTRAVVLFADPFSVSAGALLPTLDAARSVGAGSAPGSRALPPIMGGMASGAGKPGAGAFILGDQALRAAGVGVSISGAVRADALVSHGCRPIGQPLVITGAKGQIITRLAGRPALRALREAIDAADEHAKRLLGRGVFLGRVVNEYKSRFGRDDFLVRNVIGVDAKMQAIAVADLVRVGQTVQFHVRDAETASEDLGMLLDAQRLYDPPSGALLFTCAARGTRLFPAPHHDAAAVSRAFAPPPPAESLAKIGSRLSAAPAFPLAGFFAAGEIAPLGERVFLHGHTAAVLLFRPQPPPPADV